MIGGRSDESMRMRTESALPQPDVGLRTIGPVNVVAVSPGTLELLDNIADWQLLQPTCLVADTDSGDVGVRVKVSWGFLDTYNSLLGHRNLQRRQSGDLFRRRRRGHR